MLGLAPLGEMFLSEVLAVKVSTGRKLKSLNSFPPISIGRIWIHNILFTCSRDVYWEEMEEFKFISSYLYRDKMDIYVPIPPSR